MNNKIPIEKCYRLLDEGYSLITLRDGKVPNLSWGEAMKKPLTKDKFHRNYNYSGGWTTKEGEPIKATNGVGLVTGYADVEVMDVDLKVFSTAQEKKDFWDEYLSFLKAEILDFDDKFVLYKTQKEGYHILYKTKRVQASHGVAKLKGHQAYVLETRGIGGQVVIYDERNVTEKTYLDIQYISDADREALFYVSKTYDYQDPEDVNINPKPEKKIKKLNSTGITPWDEFNEQNDIWDVVKDHFTVTRRTKGKTHIKRHGSEAAHSGYIYEDSRCMYLFTDGAHPFKQRTLYNPFRAYAVLYHNGDYSAAAKDLYEQGFGERLKVEIPKTKKIEIPESELVFPIDIFPPPVQTYIAECHDKLGSSIDYMGCSLLFTISVCLGNSWKLRTKNGWTEGVTLWLALIGKAGVGKTPSIKNIIFPLLKLNNKEIRNYNKDWGKYEEFRLLDKKEQMMVEQVRKPVKSQFIADDITMEALVQLHEENRNAVGVFKDELAGWFKDMNKYREGSDTQHWLSTWNGGGINMTRKTAKSNTVERSCIPVLGGIQPSIMDIFATEENKDSGFIDRILFSFPNLEVPDYNENEIQQSLIDAYENWIISFYDDVKKNLNFDPHGEVIPNMMYFSKEGKKRWGEIQKEMVSWEKSDTELEYIKSAISKMKGYVARFSILIHRFDCHMRTDSHANNMEVSAESLEKAFRLAKYFLAMAKRVKAESMELRAYKSAIGSNSAPTDYEKFRDLYKSNPDLNKTTLAEILNVSRQTIYNYIKKAEAEKTKKK